MPEIARWLLVAGVVVAGVMLQRHRPEFARRLARACSLLLFASFACVLWTGAHEPGSPTSESHRWTGHAMVIVAWMAVWFAVAVVLGREYAASPLKALTKSALLLLTLALVLLASFTGYLIPWDQMAFEAGADAPDDLRARVVSSATLHRFVALHMIVIPALTAFSLAAWCYLFRPVRHCSSQATGNRSRQDTTSSITAARP
jgi:quinol-cytochrome oxidoreductase complex cytochrome b subunit